MTTSRRYAVAGLLLTFAWLLGGGCSASSQGDDDARPSGGNGSGGSTGGVPTVVEPDAGQLDGGTSLKLNPLCGMNVADGSCVPDDPRACSTFVPPAEPPRGAAGAGGEPSGSAGAAGEPSGGRAGAPNHGTAGEDAGAGAGGADGVSGSTSGGSAGTNATGGTTSAAGAGGAPETMGGQGGENGTNHPGLSSYGCQVTRQNNQPARECVTAGTGEANAPCFAAADCAPGLACVSDGDAGRCRPYCCDLDTECLSGTYCAERPLRRTPSDTSNIEPPHVPVCVPADNCSLEERFPCPTGDGCRCKGETACMVVRDDGSTACVKPGPGMQGDPCPCAWNHVCSRQTKECVKLCRIDTGQNECGAQRCQASSELPKNFGVCVGPI
jgi:hypothetical protein